MIELENAEFRGYGTVLVELENDKQVEYKTYLKTYAGYRKWQEDIHPDGLGYYQTFIEYDIDENDIENIEILYPNKSSEPKIKRLIKCIDVNWEVQN